MISKRAESRTPQSRFSRPRLLAPPDPSSFSILSNPSAPLCLLGIRLRLLHCQFIIYLSWRSRLTSLKAYLYSLGLTIKPHTYSRISEALSEAYSAYRFYHASLLTLMSSRPTNLPDQILQSSYLQNKSKIEHDDDRSRFQHVNVQEPYFNEMCFY